MTETSKTEGGSISFDTVTPEARINFEKHLQEAIRHLEALPETATAADRARVQLDIAEAKTGLGQAEEAWQLAREALDVLVAEEAWQEAVEACEVLYHTEQPDNIIALAHGIWLSVTYPVNPQTSLVMLNYFIDETPDNSDGAAVAAATARYLVDLRASDMEHEGLEFLTRNMLVRVAERHSKVDSQELLDFWMERMQLKNPEDFLPKMSKALDVVVGDKWWFDRDALRSRLPVN